jgi:hypothetical protein
MSPEHKCQRCNGENERWPYGLCARCQKKKDREDAQRSDHLAHHAYLSYLASKLHA